MIATGECALRCFLFNIRDSIFRNRPGTLLLARGDASRLRVRTPYGILCQEIVCSKKNGRSNETVSAR